MNTGWICHCIPSLPWKCSCSTGIKQIMGFDLFSAGLISDGSIKSALGLRQQKQEDKSALTGKCLPSALFALLEKAQSCLRGEKIVFYDSVRWNYCLAILNACKYIFLWLIKGVGSDFLQRECFEKNLDTNITTCPEVVFVGEILANVQLSSAFINVELTNNICIVFHVLQKVSCFCAGVIYWTENLPLHCS